MKKLLSVFLTFAMLLGVLSMSAVAASDTCIKLSDTSGGSGYSAGSSAVNSWVVENDGATLIFDVLVESVATPESGKVSRLAAFTGADPYNYAGFDFTNGQFTAGLGTNWPTDAQTTSYTAYSTNKYTWKLNHWYEIAYQFDGDEMTVYLDGIPMVSAEIDSAFDTEYIILYPQYCTVLIDNLRVCGKDYNVRDRYGDVYAATGFDGITSTSASSCWSFSGAGYSISTSGRPMPELSEMLPTRTVTPEISGAYLKYSEGGGIGLAASNINFTSYNGFTFVEDVRVDRKSAYASMGVRFGGNYIAGYDWDSSSFIISARSGYGFNTVGSYIYAKTEYALSTKTTYEFAVRQFGNIVSVYLNGVLMVSAANDAFATGYNKIEVIHYRLGASIDNMVVAYHDYNVREASGGSAANFTFDESAGYIDGIWDFNLDTGSTGYTIEKATPAAAVTVDSVEAADSKATVGISLANCPEYTAFELQVSYPSTLSVAQASVVSGLGGTSAMSATTSNPLVLSYVAPDGSPITDAKIMNVVFNTPSTPGKYTVSVTVIPYKNEIPCTSITGTGTITVPEAGIFVGLPDGLAYDGETLSWNAPDTALAYEIYMLHEGDKYETYVDYTEEPEYYYPASRKLANPGYYIFRVYMYDDTYELASVSKDFGVIIESDHSVFTGDLAAYATELYERLVAYVGEKSYTSANQAIIDGYMADAEYYLTSETTYSSLLETYDAYKEMIDEIPVAAAGITGDVNGDGSLDNADLSILAVKLKGGDSQNAVGADVNGDGDVDNADMSAINMILKGGSV